MEQSKVAQCNRQSGSMNPGLLTPRPVNFLLRCPLLPTDHPLTCQCHRTVPGSYFFLYVG